jgi:hypothetical protein
MEVLGLQVAEAVPWPENGRCCGEGGRSATCVLAIAGQRGSFRVEVRREMETSETGRGLWRGSR